MKKLLTSAVLAVLVCTAGAASAAVTVTVEAAGVENTTVALSSVGVESFDSAGGYSSPLSTGLLGDTGLTGSYDSALTYGADAYGGAGGVGRYLEVQTSTTITLDGDLDYFGLWASALDGGNTVEFFKDGAMVGSIDLTQYSLGAAYYGNPSGEFAGQDAGEKFAFFNFKVSTGYDEVVLVENGGGGFENDNNTFGTLAVPEPATWAMMIAGLGLMGAGLRRRRGAHAVA
jgi:hypothetical protein